MLWVLLMTDAVSQMTAQVERISTSANTQSQQYDTQRKQTYIAVRGLSGKDRFRIPKWRFAKA